MAREPNWSSREDAVVKRFAGALRRGEFRSLLATARACRRELERARRRWRGTASATSKRSFGAIQFRIRMVTREGYAELPFRRRQPDEVRVVRRYVRAYVAGRYPSMRVAAVACARELTRSARRPRPFYGVYWMLHSTAHAMGVPKLKDEWTPAENRVLNRYLRRLFEGRYRSSHEAARDCHRAMGGSRTYKAVRFAILTRATSSALPRWRGRFRSSEQRLVERYALKVHRGLLPDWLTAARQCSAGMQRLSQRLVGTGDIRPRCVTCHPLGSIHQSILRLAHKRALHGPRNPRWSATEEKIAAGWVRWYGRYRHVVRLKPMQQAAEGLQSELADKGFQRTIGACKARISIKTREMTTR